MGFDRAGAKAAGYTDAQIDAFIASNPAAQEKKKVSPFESFLSDVRNSVQKRVANVNEAVDAYGRGEQNLGSAALQLAGQAAAGVGDVIGSGVMNIAKPIVPTPVKEAVKNTATNILNTPGGQAAMNALHSGVDAYKSFKQANPELAHNIEAVVNVGSILGGEELASGIVNKVAKPVAKDVVTAGKYLVDDIIPQGTREAFSAIPLSIAQTAGAGVRKVAQAPINAALKGMQMVTGIDGATARRWFQTVRSTPQLAEQAKNIVAHDPKNAFFSLAGDLQKQITGVREKAKNMFESAVNTVREQGAGRVFNIGEDQIAQFNQTLKPYNLKIGTKLDKAKKMVQGAIVPTTRTSPFSSSTMDALTEIVHKMNTKNMSVDELLDLDKSIQGFMTKAYDSGDRTTIGLAKALTAQASKTIDTIMPEVNQANQMYRKYYGLMDTIGDNILDSSGAVKERGAESFLANLGTANKGAINANVKKASQLLGYDVSKVAQAVADAKQLAEATGNTVRNRAGDFLSSGLFVSGVTSLNLPLILSSAAIYALGNPQRYAGIIEMLAKIKSPKALQNAMHGLSEDEKALLSKISSAYVQNNAQQ